MKQIQLLIFMLVCYAPFLFAQEKNGSCKVLLKEIAGSYSGGCKDGLADGKGKAQGVDLYVGLFKNGLPEGKGTYTCVNGDIFVGNWKNGLKDGKGQFKCTLNGKATKVTGYWKNGEYAGINPPDEDYRLNNRMGIEYFSIKRADAAKNEVEISFESITKQYLPESLKVNISSGRIVKQIYKVYAQDYSLPMTCTLNFTRLVNGVPKPCSLMFTVTKTGKYDVVISYN